MTFTSIIQALVSAEIAIVVIKLEKCAYGLVWCEAGRCSGIQQRPEIIRVQVLRRGSHPGCPFSGGRCTLEMSWPCPGNISFHVIRLHDPFVNGGEPCRAAPGIGAMYQYGALIELLDSEQCHGPALPARITRSSMKVPDAAHITFAFGQADIDIICDRGTPLARRRFIPMSQPRPCDVAVGYAVVNDLARIRSGQARRASPYILPGNVQ